MNESKIDKHCEFHLANRDNLKVLERTLQNEQELEGVRYR